MSITGFVGYIYFSNKEKISEIISNGYNKVSEMDSSVFNNRYPTQLLDKDGNVLKEFKIINYKYQSYDNIDKRVMDAFIAIEDERFYEHNGIDIKGIARAGVRFVTSGFKKREKLVTGLDVFRVSLTNDGTVDVGPSGDCGEGKSGKDCAGKIAEDSWKVTY